MAISAGKKAPDFTLFNQNDESISLKDFKGQKVALFIYPQDNTPTCTQQACNMRDNIALLKKKGIAVLGLSVDSTKRHKNFETKYALPFPLLADVDHKVVNKYGVWGEKTTFGRTYMGTFRTTFLIDEKGKIAHVIEKVTSKDHAAQILEVWGL